VWRIFTDFVLLSLGVIVSGAYASEMLRYACNYDFWVIRKTHLLSAGKWILGGGIQ
jgi:hypothetical protein